MDDKPLITQRVGILFGTEIGQSESYADIIRKTLQQNGSLNITFGTLNDCPIGNLPSMLIIVISTFGTGGPPTNANLFYDSLMSYQGSLVHVKVSVLGLGSSIYGLNFNACATVMVSRLRVIGASVQLTGVIDETKDPEGAFNTFMSQLAPLYDVV